MIITVIGKGFVGKATSLLANQEVTIWFYDIIPELCSPPHLTFDTINTKSDLIFICVPTPMNLDGSCNTSIVENVLSKLSNPCVVIRSTVPVGFADRHQCFFMPEFLTEKNWPIDFYECPLWVVGSPDIEIHTVEQFFSKMKKLMTLAKQYKKIKYQKLLFCTNKEAELIKLVRNNFLSTKVIFFNHIFDLCQKMNIDYQNVIQGVGSDTRIGFSHTKVDGNTFRGYGGTCFPKDTNSLFHILQENGIKAPLLEANLLANEYHYNKDKKWLSMYNRSITDFNGNIIVYVGYDSNLKKRMENDLTLQNNHVVLFDSRDTSNIYASNYSFKQTNLSQTLFIPKCHSVVYYIPLGQSIFKAMKTWIHVITFCETYHLPLTLLLDDTQKQQFWIESIQNDITTVEIV